MIKQRVLIGGSGSTGSSLLKNILNRHPNIYSGTESALFSKRQLYNDWPKGRKKLFTKKWLGLKNHGWHMLTGVQLLECEYHLSKKDIQTLALKCNSFQDFSDQLFVNASGRKDVFTWIDKTPSNAACFKLFLDGFEDSKVIHITRNPLDTIASLISRGYNIYYATCIYLLNTASALNCMEDPNYHLVKYEELIENPKQTLQNVCAFLDLPFYDNILRSKGEIVPNSQLSGWQYDETGDIGQKSIGRYYALEEKLQQEILSSIDQIKISARGQVFYNTSISTISDIVRLLQYSKLPKAKIDVNLSKNKFYDHLRRLITLNKTGTSYPVQI